MSLYIFICLLFFTLEDVPRFDCLCTLGICMSEGNVHSPIYANATQMQQFSANHLGSYLQGVYLFYF